MDRGRSWKCCTYSLKKLWTQPKPWAVLFTLYLFLQGTYSGLMEFLQAYDESINIYGLFALQLCSPTFILLSGILLAVLLSDAPFYDEAQNAVLLRCGQRLWIRGQTWYCMVVVAIYLLAILGLQALVLVPHVQGGWSWGRVIYSVSRTNVAADYALPFDFARTVTDSFSAMGAFASAYAMRWTAFTTCTLIMFVVNMRFKTRLGSLVFVFILLIDMLDGLPYAWTIISISSLARLSNLNTGYHEYLPHIGSTIAVLLISLITAFSLTVYSDKHCDVSDMARREQGG